MTSLMVLDATMGAGLLYRRRTLQRKGPRYAVLNSSGRCLYGAALLVTASLDYAA